MSKYSEADFREAQFARTEDGLVAMRAFPGAYKSWIFVTTKGTTALRTDSSMSREDWIPVAGRTITESELEEAKRFAKHHGIRPMLHRHFGLTVVPDPEPTNAERLAEVLRSSFNDSKFDLEASFEDMARALDAAGVKAPGGDDEC